MRNIAGSSRWTRWGFAAVALLVTLTAPRPASSACNFVAPDFGQLDPNCNGGYCYVISPGLHTSDSLASAFWSFGFGDPAPGHGVDHGSLSFGNWLHPDGPSLYLLGDWRNQAIDGCVTGQIAPQKAAEIMIGLISDEANGVGFFAVASARRVANAVPEFDFTFVGGGGLARDIDLVEIPPAHVLSSTRDSILLAGPTLADVSPGVYGDGSLTPDEVVKGYRIYMKQSGATSNKTSAGWSAVTGTVPLGQNTTVSFPPCPPGGQINYGYTLIFESGFETAHVGRFSRSFCRYCRDDDGDGYPDLFGDPECCSLEATCDCNDLNASVYPEALEVCNGIDDDCDFVVDNASVPGSVAALQLEKQPGTTSLVWPALPVATSYDVVRGDLTTLLISGGSYSAATSSCQADNVSVPHVDDAEDPDPSGYGFWYLIRAANCTGVGSYDSPDPSQAAARDAGIAASGHACP